MANELTIKATPIDLQPFIFRGTPAVFDIYPDAVQGPVIRTSTVLNQSNSFAVSLQNITRIRVQVSPFGNAYPCVVVGRSIFPKIGDPANLHLFLGGNLQQFNLSASLGTTLSYPFIGGQTECELNSDWRYWTPYIYTPTGTGWTIGGSGSSGQGGTYIQSQQLFFVTFFGPRY